MDRVHPQKIRFIKLGEGGKWEASCISDGTVRLGYESPHHADALRGDWEVVRAYWLAVRKGKKGAATSDVNQISDFYELGVGDLWITFHNKFLYWCRAETAVDELPDGSRSRRTIGGWHNTDIAGGELRIDRLDGRVSKVRGFQGTICSVELGDYLVRKINAEVQPEVAAAVAALTDLKSRAATLIQGLGWKDFELLVELVFSRAGWQRFSVVGATEKDTDLDLVAPLSGRRAFVQVKSRTTRAGVLDYISRWQSHGHQEFYFVYHSCTDSLEDLHDATRGIYLMGLSELADRVVMAGLMQWLIDKRS
jgi:hypothetical protein